MATCRWLSLRSYEQLCAVSATSCVGFLSCPSGQQQVMELYLQVQICSALVTVMLYNVYASQYSTVLC